MILFTRSLDEASRTRLKEAGIEFTEVDFIKQAPSVDTDILYKIQVGLSEYVVFTSQNAIKIFFQIVENQGFILNKNIKFYTLAGTSKTLLEQYGHTPQLTADTGSALAKAMLEGGVKGVVTFICGNLRMPYLPDVLRENGVQVKELIIYNTEFNPLSCEQDFESYVFFSPSGLDAFLIKNKIPENATIVAMGKTTAGHIANKTGINEIIYPEKPTLSGLIDVIIRNK